MEQQHGVIVPNMTPQSVMKTRGSHYRRVVQGKPLTSSIAASTSASSSSLPCALAAHGQCRMCPWMSLGATLSSTTKGTLVQQCMASLSLVRRHQGVDAKVMVDVRYDETFTVPVQPHRLQEVSMRFVGAEVVRHEAQPPRQPHPLLRSLCVTDKEPETTRGGAETETTSEVNRNEENEEKGTSCVSSSLPTGGHVGPTKRVAGRFVLLTTPSSTTTPSCLLCTLEQKRLMDALNRWVQESVPKWAQRYLRAVHVVQPSHVNQEAPWQSDFLVTLCVHRCSDAPLSVPAPTRTPRRVTAAPPSQPPCANNDNDNEDADDEADWWMPVCAAPEQERYEAWSYSPLSSGYSSHSSRQVSSSFSSVMEEGLSVVEQALVEAVLQAAPLIHRVHIHVCFPNGTYDALYPAAQRRRGVALVDALRDCLTPPNDDYKEVTRTGQPDSSHAPARSVVAGAETTEPQSDYPTRAHLCLCVALQPTVAPLCVRMPACHAWLCWQAWQAHLCATHPTRHRRLVDRQTGRKKRRSHVHAAVSVWRHAGALDAVCSVLTTRLLESRGPVRVWWYDAVHPPHTMGRRDECKGKEQRWWWPMGVSPSCWAATLVMQMLLRRCLMALTQEKAALPGWWEGSGGGAGEEVSGVGRCVPEDAACWGDEKEEGHVILAPVVAGAQDGVRLCAWLTRMAQRWQTRVQAQHEVTSREACGQQYGEASQTLSVRMVVSCCSDDMILDSLQQALEQLVQLQLNQQQQPEGGGGACDGQRGWKMTGMRAGAIDVDVLSAAMVAYCVVDMSYRCS